MTKNTRTILFFLLVIAFAIVTPIVIFYSQGYRFDLENNKIVKTGGILIRSYPKNNLSLYLDDKLAPVKKMFFDNITPEEHTIIIEKEGYFTFEKAIEVEEKLITELHVVLFPENKEKEILLENVSEIYSIPNNKFIIKQDNAFYSLDTKNYEVELITEDDFDSYEVINDNILGTKNGYFYLEQNQFLDIGQTDFVINNDFYYKIDNKIYKNNELIKENIDFYNPPYYFSKGYLYKDSKQLTEEIFEIDENKEYEILPINDRIFLNENNEKLYILDDDQFKKVLFLNGILEYGPYEDKILFNTGNEIWIYSGEENTFEFITRFSYKIKNIQWINKEYFMFTTDNELIIADTDFDNVTTFIQYLNNPTIFLRDKVIYILNNNNLYFIEDILP
jgi:hypothetical protein